MKKVSLEFVLGVGLGVGLGLFLLSTTQVSAQEPLTKETLSGNVTEADISIDPAAPLPANGTVTISTEGATDTDMSGFPPLGVSVIISSDTVTITNQPVDVGTADVADGGTDLSGGASDEGTESGSDESGDTGEGGDASDGGGDTGEGGDAGEGGDTG
jgi:hypothetical protein